MKWLISRVQIGSNIFPNVHSIRFKHSRKELIQRGVIELPNIEGKLKLEDAVKVGQKVSISVGYNGKLKEEFKGYVSSVSAQIPFKIEVEDEMWQLKQTTVTKSWKEVKLKEVLEYLVPNAEINCQDVTLKNFPLNRVSKAKALEQIKDMYGLDVYYKNEKIYVGLAYLDGEDRTVIYHLQKNCLEGDKLEFVRKEDVNIKIRALSFTEDNKKVEVFYPDDNLEDYEERTIVLSRMSEKEMLSIAKERINDFIYDGYRGTVIGFGEPWVTHGMICDLKDGRYPEREAQVFIDEVETFYNSKKGFVREIVLGRRANG